MIGHACEHAIDVHFRIYVVNNRMYGLVDVDFELKKLLSLMFVGSNVVQRQMKSS